MTSKASGDFLHGLAELNIPPFGWEVHQTAEQRTRTGAQITKRIAAASQVRHGNFSFLFKAKRHGSHCLIFRPTGMGSSVPTQRHSLRASAPLCLPVSAIVSIFAVCCASSANIAGRVSAWLSLAILSGGLQSLSSDSLDDSAMFIKTRSHSRWCAGSQDTNCS